MPCVPYPPDASYKMVGLSRCATCGSRECWSEYLRWEAQSGRGPARCHVCTRPVGPDARQSGVYSNGGFVLVPFCADCTPPTY